jgi:hypothetical protein
MLNKAVGLAMDQAAVDTFWARGDVQSDPINPKNRLPRGSKVRNKDIDDDDEEEEDE